MDQCNYMKANYMSTNRVKVNLWAGQLNLKLMQMWLEIKSRAETKY